MAVTAMGAAQAVLIATRIQPIQQAARAPAAHWAVLAEAAV